MAAPFILATRNLEDRVGGVLKVVAGLAFYAFVGSWIYSGFSSDFEGVIKDFPEALTALMGGGLADTPGGYIVAVMLNLMGPLVFAGLAISWGASAIAGEEASQTARLLFSVPIRRRDIVTSRAASMLIGLALASVVFGGTIIAATSLFDDAGPAIANVAAACIHLLLFSFAIGAVALAVSAATGSKTAAISSGAGVLAVSYLVDAFVPLSAAEGVEHWGPWFLYNGSDPISSGLDLMNLGVLLAVSAVAVVAGAALIDRRDLEPSLTPLLERIPAIGVVARPRVTNAFTLSLSQRVPSAVGAGLALGVIAILMALLFKGVEASIASVAQDLPAALDGLLGGVGIDTPVGWMNAELVTILGPLAIIGLAVVTGADAIGGERDRHTLSLILSTPTSRDRLLAHKIGSLVVTVALSTGITGLGLFLGSAIAGLGLSLSGIIGVVFHLGAIAVFFGVVAVAVGTMRPRRTALSVAAGLAVASFLAQSILSSVGGLDRYLWLTPWQYFVGDVPLANGPSVGHLTVLVTLTALAAVVARELFRRADTA